MTTSVFSRRWPLRNSSGLSAALFTLAMFVSPQIASSQLDFDAFRSADFTKVYYVLRHQNSDDFGLGVDEILFTSFVASNWAVADACLAVGGMFSPVEVWSTTDVGGALPISQIVKSSIVDDASTPIFNASANGGAGAVCLGGGCTGSCTPSATCHVFTYADGTAVATPTAGVPAASLVEPLTIELPDADFCAQSDRASYTFGPGAPVVLETVCNAPSGLGFSLPNATSVLGGTNGSSIIFAFYVGKYELLTVAASGFSLGSNAGICGDSNQNVLAGVGVETVYPAPVPPTKDEQKCQKVVGVAGRVYATKTLKAVQKCRNDIFAGKLAIAPSDCRAGDQKTADKIAKAGLKMRAKLETKCTDAMVATLGLCGATIESLVAATGDGGCLLTSHDTAVDLLVEAEFGL